MALLSVTDLTVHFETAGEIARAVDGVSFSIEAAEKFGLVGESGCGKSVSALAILGLLPKRITRVSGRADLSGTGDLLSLSESGLRPVRGRLVSMVFQNPMTYLNPVFTVGGQVAEVLRLHQGMSKKDAWAAAVDLLERVRIRRPGLCAESYPWQLSGGMRQRVLIAMALACKPRLLIADEPTNALDVTVQAGILDLLEELADGLGAALWLISHDLGVIARTCDTVAVMYAGRIVERGAVREVVRTPAHPYTEGLFGAVRGLSEGRMRSTIPGQVHPATRHPAGCRFHPRCRKVMDVCRTEDPREISLSPTHGAACHLLAGD